MIIMKPTKRSLSKYPIRRKSDELLGGQDRPFSLLPSLEKPSSSRPARKGAREAAFRRYASVDSATFANGSHLKVCNNLEEQV